MFKLLFIPFLLRVGRVSSTSDPVQPGRCGYDSCTQAQPHVLNVHIVPHTHNDLGWLKTLDQYYYGSRNDIQKAGVQYILDSVVKELWEEPKRKFIYAETVYFWKWWLQQPDSVKDKVHVLVKQGRLKFAGGAWTTNDEATTNYQSIIDQFTLGLKKLNDTFGPCATPRVGWQIAPYGHSREFASLLAAMGYDGLFLGRIDFQDKQRRMQEKNMEMLWRGDDDLGSASDIFTGVLYNEYYPPDGFCFDILCNDEPIIDDVESPMYNVDKKVDEFYKEIYKIAKVYRTNNVLFTMGGDFAYQNAGMWFKNLDKLIEHSNNKSAKEGLNVTLFYSTPDCYLKAVKDANPTLPTKQDDFFPYASGEHSYWTGYYTSRPSIKYFERETNGYLQMMKQLYVLTGLNEGNNNTNSNTLILDEFKSILGVMQHHEAVTGTHRQHVTHDYERLLSKAVDNSLIIANQAFTKLITNGSDTDKKYIFKFDKCHINESACATAENSDNFVVTIYNPLAWELFGISMEIPVIESTYVIHGPNGDEIPNDVRYNTRLGFLKKNLPDRHSNATHLLDIIVGSIKPFEYVSYYVQRKPSNLRNRKNPRPFAPSEPRSIPPNYHERLGYYTAWTGNNTQEKYRSSGAYVFRPKITKLMEKKKNNGIYKHSHDRLNDRSERMRTTWYLPAIEVEDGIGKETIFIYNTLIKNNGEFYTDSNGRQMIKRKLKEHDLTVKEPVAGNYYPATNKIYIKDDKKRYIILFDRTSGVYSTENGSISTMYDRRLLHDDGFGIDEPLNENLARIITTYVIENDADDKENIIDEKTLTFEFQLQNIVLFSDATNLHLTDWLKFNNRGSLLKKPLPVGLHLLTLEPWDEGTLLLRIENYLELSDRNETNISIDVSDMFTTLTLKSLKETTLAGNQWLKERKRWVWNKENEFVKSFNEDYGSSSEKVLGEDIILGHKIEGFTIEIQAKQIRTFIAEYETKNMNL